MGASFGFAEACRMFARNWPTIGDGNKAVTMRLLNKAMAVYSGSELM